MALIIDGQPWTEEEYRWTSAACRAYNLYEAAHNGDMEARLELLRRFPEAEDDLAEAKRRRALRLVAD